MSCRYPNDSDHHQTQRDSAAHALLADPLAPQRAANHRLQLALTITAQAAIAIASSPSTTDRRVRRGFVLVGLCDTCPRPSCHALQRARQVSHNP
jgi:uncharacterized protein YciW